MFASCANSHAMDKRLSRAECAQKFSTENALNAVASAEQETSSSSLGHGQISDGVATNV